MSDPIFKIEGVEVAYPANIQELRYDVTADKDIPEVDININEWEFTKEHKEIFDNWRSNYFFEGLEASLDVAGEGKIEDTLEFLLSVKDANPISCDKETIPAIERLNQLKENRAFTIEFLFEGVGFPHERMVFVDVPYCKNAPKNAEVFMTLLSTAFLVIEIENLLDELIDKIVNASSFEWGEWIASIPFFIKAVSVSLASIQILQQLYNLLVQPVKYHKAMKLIDMFTVGYSYLGYDFQSDLLNQAPFNQWYIMPKKRQVPFNEDSKNNLLFDLLNIDLNVLKGFTNPDDSEQTAFYEGTFDDLVNGWKEGLNLKEVVEEPSAQGGNPIIRLELKNWNKSSDRVDLPPVDIEEWTFNSDEFIANYSVRFLTDSSDINTIQNYNGTEFKEFVTPSTDGIKNRKNQLVSGSKEVVIPFARGIRKTSLNKTEIMLDKLFTAVEPIINEFVFQHNVKLKQAITIASTIIDLTNTIINAINTLPAINVNNVQLPPALSQENVPFLTVPDFSELISDRVGMLLLEEDEFEVDKVIMLDENYTLSNATEVDSDYILAPQFFDLFNPDNIALLQGIEAVGESPRQNRLHPDNELFLDAEWIWKNCHWFESFVPNINGVTDWNNGDHSQYKKYDAQQLLLCVNDFKKIKRSNFVRWCEKDGKFFSNYYYEPFSNIFEGKIKINEIYYDKLISIKTKPNGSTRTKKFG